MKKRVPGEPRPGRGLALALPAVCALAPAVFVSGPVHSQPVPSATRLPSEVEPPIFARVDPAGEEIPLPDPDEPLEDLCTESWCVGLFTGFSPDDCYRDAWKWDVDQDGVMDGCEHGHAQLFAPEFRFARDCNWDSRLSRMGGEYFFAAEFVSYDFRSLAVPPAINVMRIIYMPAYYSDCGTPDALGQDPPHSGDSEFVIMDIVFDYETNHWLVDAVFLSAHCPSGDCRWYQPSAFPATTGWVDDTFRGAPRIWVAERKHANYPTRSRCNGGGAFGFDSCRASTIFQRFPVAYTQQNVGSRDVPNRDCGSPFSSSSLPDDGTVECIWSWQPPSCEVFGSTVACLDPLERFNGWYDSYWGAAFRFPMPYGQILEDYARF